MKSFLTMAAPSCGKGSNPYKDCPKVPTDPVNPVTLPPTEPVVEVIVSLVNQVIAKAQFAQLLGQNLNLEESQVAQLVESELKIFQDKLLGLQNPVISANPIQARVMSPAVSSENQAAVGAIELMMFGAEVQRAADNLCHFHALRSRLSKAADSLIDEGFKRMDLKVGDQPIH